jgi:hypothetical protein
MVVERSTSNKKRYMLSKKPRQKTNGADMLTTQYLNANMGVTIKPAVPNSAQKDCIHILLASSLQPKKPRKFVV